MNGTPPAAPPPVAPTDWHRYVVAVARHKWIVLAVTLAGTLAGVVATRFLDPRYAARATLWIEVAGRERDPLAADGLVLTPSWSTLVTSHAVIDPVVRGLRLFVRPDMPNDHAALATLAAGVRAVHGEALADTPREELVEDLSRIFGGADELKGALEDAFERSLQTLVIGLKQAWLLGSMETPDGKDYCEAFGEQLRGPFVAEHGLEGRLFIDFLDGFFLDYDTAREFAVALGAQELADALAASDAGR